LEDLTGKLLKTAILQFSFFEVSLMQYPLCQHIMTSGAGCGSPAVKGQPYCHHHHSLRRLLPKRFVAWDGFVNDNVHGTRFIPMPLLEDALSIQTAYMQIIHGVLSGQMQMPQARIALMAVRAAARNLPWVKTERAAIAGEQSELARDVSETREKVWSNDDYRTLRDNTWDPATAAAQPSAAADDPAPAGGTQPNEQPQAAIAPLPPRKQPDAEPAEPARQEHANG
jgi:hypothetical protein